MSIAKHNNTLPNSRQFAVHVVAMHCPRSFRWRRRSGAAYLAVSFCTHLYMGLVSHVAECVPMLNYAYTDTDAVGCLRRINRSVIRNVIMKSAGGVEMIQMEIDFAASDGGVEMIQMEIDFAAFATRCS